MSELVVLRPHSKLGASSYYRWKNCAGSVALCEQMPPQKDSVYAAEGSNGHTLLEKVLTESPNANYYVGKKLLPFEVSQEMADYVQGVVDYIRQVKREVQGELFVEQKFHLVELHPDLYGTADAVIISDFLGELHVIDFKYGAGVFVEVEDNEQLMYYALGALLKFGMTEFSKVVIHICQPRMESEDGTNRKQSFSIEQMIIFSKHLVKDALATEDPKASLHDGDWCGFCKAAPICPQLRAKAMEVARTDFDDLNMPHVSALTPDQIAKVVQHAKQIENWLEAVKSYAREELQAGRRIADLKLVAGRGSRQWNNESEAAKTLGSELGERAYNRKLLSVAQAEKILGKSAIEGLFFTSSGSPTVAHETDRRKALPSAKDDFGKLESITTDDF